MAFIWKYLIVSSFYLCIFLPSSLAQSELGDPRLSEMLASLKYPYQMKEDGTYYLTLPLEQRSQLIFIDSKTSSYEDLEIREMYSVIYKSDKKPTEAILYQLLFDNSVKKIGAWEILQSDHLYLIVFTVKVPVDLSTREFQLLIELIATSADQMEEKIFMSDDW